MKVAWTLLVIFIFVGGTLPLAGKEIQFVYDEQNVLDFYNYDQSVPLEASIDTTGTILIYYKFDVEFTSIHGERVPAKMWIPKSAKPDKKIGCILWLHGYGGNKEIDDMAFGILGPGLKCAFLSLDAQYHGERKEPGKAMFSLDLLQDRYAIAQTIMDYRRALDLLAQLPTIDMDNIGVLGLSMGGILGALLAGVEPRIKASVIIVGGGHWSAMMPVSDHPTAPPLRKYLKGHYQLLDRLLEPVDPLRLIHRVHNLQMHNGTEDITVPYATAVEIFEKAPEPNKEFHSYPNHTHLSMIQDPATIMLVFFRTMEWFKKHLSLPE